LKTAKENADSWTLSKRINDIWPQVCTLFEALISKTRIISASDFGGAHAPPFCAVQRLNGVFHKRSNDWLSVFRGFLRFLKGSKTTPIRRTEKPKPADFQRVLCVILGLEMELNLLKCVTSKRFLWCVYYRFNCLILHCLFEVIWM
jgi:hypothetical protein